jgi:hypothetical protein
MMVHILGSGKTYPDGLEGKSDAEVEQVVMMFSATLSDLANAVEDFVFAR